MTPKVTVIQLMFGTNAEAITPTVWVRLPNNMIVCTDSHG